MGPDGSVDSPRPPLDQPAQIGRSQANSRTWLGRDETKPCPDQSSSVDANCPPSLHVHRRLGSRPQVFSTENDVRSLRLPERIGTRSACAHPTFKRCPLTTGHELRAQAT